MGKKALVKGLIASFMALLILSIVSFVFDFYFKIAISLFLVNFALLFFLKVGKTGFRKEEPTNNSEKESMPTKILKFAVLYGISLLILGLVIYINWLPFGFEKVYALNVGAIKDTNVDNEIYLKKNEALSEPLVDENGNTYRLLNGSTFLIIQPNVALKNFTLNIEKEGNIFLVSPKIEFYPEDYEWETTLDLTNPPPNFLQGNSNYYEIDRCTYFDGQSKLEYPNTENKFESGPFSLYIEWSPEYNENKFQQVVGHYNWEVIQEKDKVIFTIGRMNNKDGPFYSFIYPIDQSFFEKKHTAIIVYFPNKEEGYIELIIDNKFIGRKYIGKDIVWKDYNKERVLTFGKSGHGIAEFYKGCVYKLYFGEYPLFFTSESLNLYNVKEQKIEIPLVGNGRLYSLTIFITEK